MPGLPEFTCSHWKLVFPHENPAQGQPTSVDAVSLHRLEGWRQAWRFRVGYAMGDIKELVRTSDGIDLGVTKEQAQRLLDDGIPVQKVTDGAIADLDKCRSAIAELLGKIRICIFYVLALY